MLSRLIVSVNNKEKMTLECPHCGQALGEETCPACQHSLPAGSRHCYWCGEKVEGGSDSPAEQEMGATDDAEGSVDFASRKLCSDGTCIGVIGSDGRCKECGKPYTGEPEEG